MSSAEVKGPFSSLYAMIARALDSPTPVRVVSWDTSAVFRLIFWSAPDAFLSAAASVDPCPIPLSVLPPDEASAPSSVDAIL